MKKLSPRALSLRIPMQVTRIRLFYPTGAYPMCPKCGSTMEQEYQDVCVFCSQRLDWEVYQKAVGTPPGGKGDHCQKNQAGG